MIIETRHFNGGSVMRRNIFLGTLLFVTSLLLSACGNSGGGNSSAPESSNLELLYFGKPTNAVPINNRLLMSPYRLNDGEPEEKHYDVQYYEGIELEAHVKNTERLSFLDIVVFSQSTGKKYVFNDGNGEYRVESSTVLDGEVWITKIRFSDIWTAINVPRDTCVLDTYLEIEEINFLSLTGSVTKTDINNGDVKKVSLHAFADQWNEEYHQWSEWTHQDRTCDEWAGRYRYCSVCGQKAVQEEGEQPTGHVYSGLWRLETASPTVIRKGDRLVAVDGICSVCKQAPVITLPSFYTKLELVIPEGIVEIGDSAFYEAHGLTSVTLPSSIKSIGYQGFGWTESMKEIYFASEVPPSIGGDVFAGTWDHDDFKIYVPLGSANAYKSITADYWQESAVSHIVEYEKEDIGCVDGKGHNLNWTITEQATCTRDGKKSGECSKCGRHYELAIPATGHSYSEKTISGSNGQVSYVQKSCSRCGATALSIRALDGTLAEGSSLKTNNVPSGFFKLARNDFSASYSFKYSGQTRSAKLYQYAVADGWTGSNRSYSYYGPVSNGNKPNFGVTFNGASVDISSMKGVSYEEMLAGGEDILGDHQYSPIADCLIGDVTIKNGDNSFTYTRLDSYGLCIKDFVIVME